jgi:hypothetical protein
MRAARCGQRAQLAVDDLDQGRHLAHQLVALILGVDGDTAPSSPAWWRRRSSSCSSSFHPDPTTVVRSAISATASPSAPQAKTAWRFAP